MFRFIRPILLSFAGLILLGVLVYQLPAVKSRLDWRYEVWSTYLKNVVDPVGKMPTPLPSTPFAPFTPLPPTPIPLATESPSPTPVPLPPTVSLATPKYELQGINNCGPSTLAMTLRMYGWEGDQYDIAKVIKPVEQDRNVRRLPEPFEMMAGKLVSDRRPGTALSLSFRSTSIPLLANR